MPAVDPPGLAHHLRITKDLSGVLGYYKDVSGVVIVLHPTSSKEKPHYHIWIDHQSPVTGMTVKNRLKTGSKILFQGNGDWSIRSHDSWDSWYQYAMNPLKGATEVLYNSQRLRPDMSKLNVIVTDPGYDISGSVPKNVLHVVQHNLAKTAKAPAVDRFIDYFNKQYIRKGTTRIPLTDVADGYVDWTSGNYQMRYATNIVQSAYYVLNGKPADIKDKMSNQILYALNFLS